MIKNSRNIEIGLLPKLLKTSMEGIDKMSASRYKITMQPLRKPKRFRSAFTTEQIRFLEQQFKKFPYISCEHRKEIASALNLQERAIKIWFQNRRMKEKKDSVHKEIDYEITSKVDEQDRLINACTLPSTNDHIPHSLPLILKQDNDKNARNTSLKVSNDKDIQEKNPKVQTAQNLSRKHARSPRDLTLNANIKQTLFAENKTKSSPTQGKSKNKLTPTKVVSKFFVDNKIKKPSDVCNRFNAKLNILKNTVTGAKTKPYPEDLSTKNPNTPMMSTPQASTGPQEVRIPYYSMMPSVYSHPYISSGGMIWKPVNIMPVMSAGSNSNLQNHGAGMRKPCNCNCHDDAAALAQTSNSYHPYNSPYMPTAFSNTKY